MTNDTRPDSKSLPNSKSLPDPKSRHVARVVFSLTVTALVGMGGYLAIRWLLHLKA
jgi:hypothetical protein